MGEGPSSFSRRAKQSYQTQVSQISANSSNAQAAATRAIFLLAMVMLFFFVASPARDENRIAMLAHVM